MRTTVGAIVPENGLAIAAAMLGIPDPTQTDAVAAALALYPGISRDPRIMKDGSNPVLFYFRICRTAICLLAPATRSAPAHRGSNRDSAG